ncbi:MAG: hypothetical protein QOI33_3761, partial [Mycobacterium sp.]|nr:hypothetical protein [Mycobacterium sp.]
LGMASSAINGVRPLHEVALTDILES